MFLNGEDQGVAAMDVPQVSCATNTYSTYS